jgi:hypothetical protein
MFAAPAFCFSSCLFSRTFAFVVLRSAWHLPDHALPLLPWQSNTGKMRMGVGAPGVSTLLKDGFKHFSGLEEAILKNVEACKQLAQITRTSLGPNGA